MATQVMKCKECEGILEVDADREILSCPYCGSKELIVETDRVKIERIRSRERISRDLGRAEIKRHEKIDELDYKERKDKRDNHVMLGLGVFLILWFNVFFHFVFFL